MGEANLPWKVSQNEKDAIELVIHRVEPIRRKVETCRELRVGGWGSCFVLAKGGAKG